MHILHCTPLGSSIFADFINRLQEAGRQGKAGRIALVLPSPYLLERARTVLREADIPAWEFPRIFSLDELAADLSGFRKISRLEQECLIGQIVRESADSGNYPYFNEIFDLPGFISALARLFDEVKMAAVTTEELECALEALADEGEQNLARDEAVCGLFRAYQVRLGHLKLMDLGGMYWLAIQSLAQDDFSLPFEQLFMAEFSVLSPLRLQLVREIKKRIPVEIGMCFEKNRPGVFRSVERVYQELVGMGFQPQFHREKGSVSPALGHLRRLLFHDDPASMENADGIQILICPNRSKELAVAADRIKSLLLDAGYSPHDVAVVVSDPGSCGRLRSVFEERGIPVDRAEAVSVLERALPKLVSAWLEMLQSNGSRAAVVAVLKVPYVEDRLKWDADRLEFSLQDEVIRNWGDWPAAIERRVPDEETGRHWRNAWEELQRIVAEWQGAKSWSEWAERLQILLSWLDIPATVGQRRRAGILNLFEARAELQCFEALLEAAGELARLDDLTPPSGAKVSADEFSDALRQLLQDTAVDLSERQSAGVQVVKPETASGMNFRAVFLLGLAEGNFPAPPRESWLYGDKERRNMREAGILMLTSDERKAAEDFSFALAAAMATETLVLGAWADSETLPSRFLSEVQRLYDKGAISSLSFGLHQVVAEQADDVRSRRELLNGAIHHLWRNPGRSALWDDIWLGLPAQIIERLEQRAVVEENRTGVFAGRIEPSLIEISRFSPSGLELYASCPFAYFVKEVMGLSEWGEAREGFGALSAGLVWHEVLATFFEQLRGEKLLPEKTALYLNELVDLLDTVVDRCQKTGRIVPDSWWPVERTRWETAFESRLAGEFERQAGSNWVPKLLEWSFGSEPRFGCDPASTGTPLVLADGEAGGSVEITGKVDRIDVDGKRYRVIDYKTGKPPSRKQVEQGLKLQVVLYMMAIERLLCRDAETAVEGLYLQVGESSSFLAVPGGRMTCRELFGTVTRQVCQYATGIRSGIFSAEPAGPCPDYCAALTFCRRTADQDSEVAEESADE